MLKRLVLIPLVLAASVLSSAAQTTVVLVRHAERADTGAGGMAADPALSAAGRARARALAAVLKDTKLTAVFATEYKRTQQTAAPAAQAHGLTVTTVKASDTAALVEKLKAAKGAVLVVGHSNTIADVMSGLGIADPVTIGDSEYDNLFIVVSGTPPTLLRLRYR